jgi:hypothetical protein
MVCNTEKYWTLSIVRNCIYVLYRIQNSRQWTKSRNPVLLNILCSPVTNKMTLSYLECKGRRVQELIYAFPSCIHSEAEIGPFCGHIKPYLKVCDNGTPHPLLGVEWNRVRCY